MKKAKISIEVVDTALAPILAFLAQQPLLKLHVDFEEEKPRKSSKPLLRDAVMAQYAGAEKPIAVSKPMSKDLIRHALQDGPMRRRDLLKVSYEHDLTTNAIDWGIRDLKRRGEITESDEHVISLLNGEAARPAPLDIEARPLSGIEVILSILADGGEHPRDELRRGFGRTGLKPKGFDARLSDAVARGLVERVGENVFRRTAAGAATPP